ncbi:hypothetical protein ASE37_02240 [Rhizobium sp. Root268]|nr:hypothetical protein ASC86_02240 [Rhizobium sp. Root1212]KRD37832.1 hypothetical protein ASE37_02240 [Rhizobium sp. Root268]
MISQLSWWEIVLFVLIGVVEVSFLAIMIGAFLLSFVSVIQILGKSGYPYVEPDDDKLSWVQRMGRRQTRAGLAFVSTSEFTKEWKRFALSATIFLSCLTVILIFSLFTKH